MTYNAENLYDSEHPSHLDNPIYRPLVQKKLEKNAGACRTLQDESLKWRCENWDYFEENVQAKVERIAKVVQMVRSGRGPDILIVQEVENRSLLKKLRAELSAQEYRSPIFVEADPLIANNIGVLSRLALFDDERPQLLKIPYKDVPFDQRHKLTPVLFMSFRLPSWELLTLYAVDLPDPVSFPDAVVRKQAMDFIQKHSESLKTPSDVPRRYIVVAGSTYIQDLNKDLSEGWMLPHLSDCDNRQKKCPGTVYNNEKKQWMMADQFWLSPNLVAEEKSAWYYVPNSFKVVMNGPNQKNYEGVPIPFDLRPHPIGISDHFPVVIDLQKDIDFSRRLENVQRLKQQRSRNQPQ